MKKLLYSTMFMSKKTGEIVEGLLKVFKTIKSDYINFGIINIVWKKY